MIVAEALAGGVTVAGLTAQTGVDVVACDEDAWHVRSTVPLKPLIVPIVMFEDEVPPGATASGENGVACRVKSCADACDVRVAKAAMQHRTASRACPVRKQSQNFDKLDFDDSYLNMSRLGFQ